MTFTVSNLMIRNLHDVFGESDSKRRRAAIDEILTDDCVFYDFMGGVFRGHNEIYRIAGALRVSHLDFRYLAIAESEEAGNGGRGR